MTTQEVRKRLYKLSKRMFTNSFIQNVEMINAQISEDQAASLMDQHEGDANSYIQLASQLISSDISLHHLAKIVNPLVAHTVYMRYHIIVQCLVGQTKTEHAFSNDDSAFIIDVFINYWQSLPSGLSK